MVKASRFAGPARAAPVPEPIKSRDIVSISLDMLYFEKDQYGISPIPHLIYHDGNRPPTRYIIQNLREELDSAILLQYGRIMNDGDIFVCSVWDSESQTYLERHFVSYKDVLKDTQLTRAVLKSIEKIENVPIIKHPDLFVLQCA